MPDEVQPLLMSSFVEIHPNYIALQNEAFRDKIHMLNSQNLILKILMNCSTQDVRNLFIETKNEDGSCTGTPIIEYITERLPECGIVLPGGVE